MKVDLFDEWKRRERHVGETFITDGAIDPHRWTSVDKRVLFVAKEAYGEKDQTGSWDLPTLIREEWGGPKYKMWWTVGYWALAIHGTSTDRLATYPTDEATRRESARQAVLDSAILNIKKSGGTSTSDDEDLKSYAEADGDLIKRQFESLDPDITIFCYTWHLVDDLWIEAEEVSQFVRTWGDKPHVFVDYWHPANHYPDSVMFYALSALYQKALIELKRSSPNPHEGMR